MRSFFRFIIVIVLLIGAFVGGWFFSDVIKQDPFLSNIFSVKSGQYDRFIHDLSAVIQELRINDQSQLMEQILNNPITASSSSIHPEEVQSEVDSSVKEVDGENNSPVETDVEQTETVATVEPNTMLGGIVQQMSAKEKLTFLIWARSRFTNEQLKQIETLLQDGITPDNFLTLYQYTRKSLNGNDFEYLLSFVDRYITTIQPQVPDDAIPVFQAKESSVNKPN